MFHKKANEGISEKAVEDQYVENTAVENHKLEDGGDYSGAVAKTDPKEIALVKKLDIRIMGILWAMYFLVCSTISNLLSRRLCSRPRLTV